MRQILGRILLVSLLLITFTACSSQPEIELPEHIKNLENVTVYSPSEVQAADTVLLEREQTFGDTELVLMGDVTDMAVDAEGRVYIADGEHLNIKVYDSDGQLITQLGRSGEGPGEFRGLNNIEVTGETLFARDPNQQRAVLFSLDSLTYSHTVPLPHNRKQYKELADAYPGEFYVRNDGRFFMDFTKSKMPENASAWDKIGTREMVFLLNEDGEITSEKLMEGRSNIQVLVPLGGPTVGFPVAFYGKSLTTVSEDDHLFRSWSQELLVKEYDSNGEYLRAFYYPYERAPLDPESAIQQMGNGALLQKGMQEMAFPEQWPATDDMLIDDQNRIWLSTIPENRKQLRWWVLEESGKPIARFSWSGDKSIEETRDGYLYTHETEEETGIQQVVRYRIEL